jgi:hypothetical protein
MTKAQVEAYIAEHLAGDDRYKALQTALNKNVQKFQQDVSARDARIADLQSRLDGNAEATDFIGAQLLDALPEADRAKVEAQLRDREMKALRKEIADLKKPAAQTGQPQAVPAYQDDFEEQLKKVLAEAQESLEDTVRSHGLDPTDKGFDFGKEDETFAARLKKLNQSIAKVKAAKDEQDVDSVRQKNPVPPTRTGGGAASGSLAGDDLLSVGAKEIWEKMQRERAAKR